MTSFVFDQDSRYFKTFWALNRLDFSQAVWMVEF